ncbi:hypothetical protein [Phyllobacterium endophyticum]|nr:hypothetical protein [Phyllobacterium endophyticum]MBB3234525.1 hypothetical protein [Phyllobacterium endophyticum]TYR38679.1 hypothetical protein FY050_22070 [Phyllobacterium endophyticum]
MDIEAEALSLTEEFYPGHRADLAEALRRIDGLVDAGTYVEPKPRELTDDERQIIDQMKVVENMIALKKSPDPGQAARMKRLWEKEDFDNSPTSEIWHIMDVLLTVTGQKGRVPINPPWRKATVNNQLHAMRRLVDEDGITPRQAALSVATGAGRENQVKTLWKHYRQKQKLRGKK